MKVNGIPVNLIRALNYKHELAQRGELRIWPNLGKILKKKNFLIKRYFKKRNITADYPLLFEPLKK